MEMWRSTCSSSLHTNLKAILSSSLPLRVRNPSLLPNPSRHFKTVALFPHRCAFSSSLLRSFHLYPTKPISFKPNTIEPDVGLTLRAFSSLSSSQELEWKEPSSLVMPQEEQSRVIPVKTYFLCTSVDLSSLQAENRSNLVQPTSRASSSNYACLEFCNYPHELEVGFESGSNCRYLVVFNYGSVVLFNVPEHEVDEYLEIVKKHASGLLTEKRKDDYAVVEKPTLKTWMEGGLDYIALKNLDIDGIRTIGSVLGQSIALDYYIRQVDGMVAEFTDINRGMEKTGTFTMQRKKLFQLVGKANSNLADVILKLGVFERSDVAWKYANYAQIWEYLRDEYELTQRFGNLDFKLKFVEHNIRFLQEILQNRKSETLEWLIIILIGIEVLISIYDIVRQSKITSL
ncbi:hypothetical protein MRB53_011279 [Persea americana]|uniref:Uncharacterized protein n=1 Tax=Persea americana TaxID=3435 RepID=A0ACC2LUD7_PERAE|nr:hypothetical protein MRB53_011279 [Persea americana]|eukprot:TRINITY_DN1500_c0_g2_i1.p1 TRINITY_DN1500_c0_g2~~TRINITY_DN1500_c0_g2_i1.p1  ORF type:complete len:401 (+),score=59.46 TRINITY_DN1500_c0_g2_i1:233-1435(+)